MLLAFTRRGGGMRAGDFHGGGAMRGEATAAALSVLSGATPLAYPSNPGIRGLLVTMPPMMMGAIQPTPASPCTLRPING
jgi:hypothetical protein